MSMPDDVNVLVVGAGPTGLLAACELRRRGVPVRLIDRAAAPSPRSRALLLWPRSLDLLADLGARADAEAAGLPITAFSYFSDRRPLATVRFTPELMPLCLPQSGTEQVLTAALHRLGGRVERGVRLLALDGLDYSGRIAAGDRVTAILEHADGTVERCRVEYVVGADGAGSAVRGQIGTGFLGSTYGLAFALVDAPADGPLPADRALYHQSPAGALVIVPLPGGRYRFFASLPPGEQLSVELMQRILDHRGPGGVRIGPADWQSVFRVHRRHAPRFQLGRVFLAGDAAHVHSPAGGQGLNTGLQDAHNLAWKLAAVLHGEAPVDLLASYGPERQAVAHRVVRDTDLQTRAWLLGNPAAVALRDTAFRTLGRSGVLARLYAPVMAGRRLVYPPVRPTQLPSGAATCTLRARMPGGIRVGGVAPVGIGHPAGGPRTWTLALVDPDRVLAGVAAGWPQVAEVDVAAVAGCERPGYHLIRPDGHIQAHGHAGDRDRLLAELTTVLGAPDPAERPSAASLLPLPG
jgi:2-polyprenyl-6-methoxyphenol hydroxylase-like FAD-dependent oxidoreductase